MKTTYSVYSSDDGLNSLVLSHLIDACYPTIDSVVQMAFKIPFHKLPQYVNDTDEVVKAIVKARLAQEKN